MVYALQFTVDPVYAFDGFRRERVRGGEGAGDWGF